MSALATAIHLTGRAREAALVVVLAGALQAAEEVHHCGRGIDETLDLLELLGRIGFEPRSPLTLYGYGTCGLRAEQVAMLRAAALEVRDLAGAGEPENDEREVKARDRLMRRLCWRVLAAIGEEVDA